MPTRTTITDDASSTSQTLSAIVGQSRVSSKLDEDRPHC